jgi:hypothetical protein
MSWDYIIQLLPIICIAVSAVICAFGYLFKLSFECTRSARLVLYHLLEIRRLAVRQAMVPDRLIREMCDRVSSECRAKGIILPEDLMKATLQPVIETVVKAKILATEDGADPADFERLLWRRLEKTKIETLLWSTLVLQPFSRRLR